MFDNIKLEIEYKKYECKKILQTIDKRINKKYSKVVKLLFQFFYAILSIIMFEWYILMYSYVTIIGTILVLAIFYTTKTINSELFIIISALIALFGIVIQFNKNRKQKYNEKCWDTYNTLFKVLIEAVNKFKNKESVKIDDELLVQLLSFSSDRVYSIASEIFYASNNLKTEEDVDLILNDCYMLILLIRKEIQFKRDLYLGGIKINKFTIEKLLSYERFNMKAKKFEKDKSLKKFKRQAKKTSSLETIEELNKNIDDES